MGNASLSKTKPPGRTISAIVMECVLIASFYIVFHSGMHDESSGGISLLLLLLYPLGISIGMGIIIAAIAGTRHLVSWKWGMLASATTLILMLTMVCVPTMWSGVAFIIAPIVSLAIFPMLMNSDGKTVEQ